MEQEEEDPEKLGLQRIFDFLFYSPQSLLAGSIQDGEVFGPNLAVAI